MWVFEPALNLESPISQQNFCEGNIVSEQTDATFWRTLTLLFSGLFGFFVLMIALARAIVY